jgi:cbb3-type cytochrome oxidase subunit 3
MTFVKPVNRIGRQIAVCMIALVLIAIVVSLFRP